jgi:hypothetical protein
MEITRSSIDTVKGPADWFTGDVYIDGVAAAPSPARVQANLVHFTPGATPPKQARETIKNEFAKLKTFSGIQAYTFRDTGDAHVPGRVLAVDPQRGVWKFAGS